MQARRLCCPGCHVPRLAEDRFCRFCGRSFVLPAVRAATQALAPFVARRPPTRLWQGLALLAIGAVVTLTRRWAVRQVVRSLLPMILARALPLGGSPRTARVTELTVTLSHRIEQQ